MGNLGRAFKDAIAITSQIDIKYLWIDSLRIIQQDVADWDREAKKIGAVYRNSFLAVAVA